MKGWYKDSYRHYLAAKGVKTNKYLMAKWDSPSEKKLSVDKAMFTFKKQIARANSPAALYAVMSSTQGKFKFMLDHNLITQKEFDDIAVEVEDAFDKQAGIIAGMEVDKFKEQLDAKIAELRGMSDKMFDYLNLSHWNLFENLSFQGSLFHQHN